MREDKFRPSWLHPQLGLCIIKVLYLDGNNVEALYRDVGNPGYAG